MAHRKGRVVWLAAIGLLMTAAASNAQVNEEWCRRYDSPGHSNDYAHCIAVDSAGGIIAAGQSAGAWLTIKYDALGDTIWIVGDNYATAGAPLAMTVDADRNIFVAGYHYTGWVSTGNQYVLVKYNAAGVKQWTAAYDGRGGPTDDFARAVAVDDAGFIYVTGQSNGPYREGIATIKFNPNGSRSSTWPDVGFGIGVRRYDVAGQSGTQNGVGLAVDGTGNVFVAGVSAPYTSVANDYVTIKYDAAGNEIWTRRYDGPAANEDSPVAIAIDDSSNVYVAGTSYGPNQTGASRGDYATVKYDTDGNLKWVARYNGPANYEDRCTGMVMDSAANIYVTGSAMRASPDFATIKYTRNGHEEWTACYDAPTHNADEAKVIAVDPLGCVYVAGSISTDGASLDCATVAYNAQGQELWSIAYNGPDNQSDSPNAMAVDAGRSLYVLATSSSATWWEDYATVKYAQPVSAVDGTTPAEGARFLCGPNPFRSSTAIEFTIAQPQDVTLQVFDIAGRAVATLADGRLPAGSYRHQFDAAGLSSGLYFVRLQVGAAMSAKRIVLIRE